MALGPFIMAMVVLGLLYYAIRRLMDDSPIKNVILVVITVLAVLAAVVFVLGVLGISTGGFRLHTS